MSLLHISKVAVGCTSLEALRRRQEARREGGTVPIGTRYRPKQADALIGGSRYWIVRHCFVARQTILGFEQGGEGRTIIRLDAELVPVRPMARRAHQGWRYLAEADAPTDLASAGGEGEALPEDLAARLAALALI